MAFTIDDFRDLLQLLEQHPAWRTELRRWVLSDDLLALPQTMHELAEAQRRTEERVGQLAAHMDELARRITAYGSTDRSADPHGKRRGTTQR